MKLLTRRQFLGASAAGAAGLAAGPLAAPLFGAARGNIRFPGPYGVQMYSIRKGMQTNPAAALKMVRSIGYTQIECWQPNGVNATELKPLLKAAHLVAPGMHTVYGQLLHNMPSLIRNAHILGAEWVVCAWVDAPLRQSGADYLKLAKHFNQFGRELRRAGLRLGYHNHTQEFIRFGGVPALDILMRHTDPNLMWLELDIGHCVRAGANPVTYLHRYPKRTMLLHLKDVAPNAGIKHPTKPTEYHDVPMGTGIIDLKGVLLAAYQNHVQHYYVEDEAAGAVRPELTDDYNYLRRVRF